MNKLSLRVTGTNDQGWLGRLVTITPLIVTGANLIIAITLPIFHYEYFLEKARKELENRGLIPEWFDNIRGFLWRQVTADTVAEHEIWWHQAWAIGYFILAICFYFIIAHWQDVKYIVSGMIIIVFGLIYMVIPVDIFPDFLPVAGSLDDMVIAWTSSGTGISIWGEYAKRRKLLRKVHSYAEQKPLKALETLCEEYGLELDIKTTVSKNKNQ